MEYGKYNIEFPNIQERLNVMLEHLNLAIEEKGENIAIREMRKHLACYIKNLENASKMREKINTINSKNELIEYLKVQFFYNS